MLFRSYFAGFKGRLRTLEDTYFAIFSPIGIGKHPTDILYAEGSKAYAQNIGFDRVVDPGPPPKRKGCITCADVSRTIRELYLLSLSKPRVPVCSEENPYA